MTPAEAPTDKSAVERLLTSGAVAADLACCEVQGQAFG